MSNIMGSSSLQHEKIQLCPLIHVDANLFLRYQWKYYLEVIKTMKNSEYNGYSLNQLFCQIISHVKSITRVENDGILQLKCHYDVAMMSFVIFRNETVFFLCVSALHIYSRSHVNQ